MKKLIILIISVLLVIPATAQRSARLQQAGDEFFRNEEYTRAIVAYDKALRRDRSSETRRELSFKMGESYRNLLNYSEAWKWYTVALNVGYQDPEIYLHLSQMALGLEYFDSSIYYAEKYLEKNPGDQAGEKVLESAVFSKENYFLESLIEVTNETEINSDGQEWGVGFLENIAVFHQDPEKRAQQYDIDIQLKYNNIIYWALRSERLKDRIVFASTKDESGRLDTRTGTGFSSIYQATYSRREGKWDSPSLLNGGINSDQYEGFLSFDASGLTAYFMNCGGYRGNRNTCDIYTSEYDAANDRWTTPEIFPFNSDEFNIGYPSIDEDENILYFASDMPGGYGGYDLYLIKRDKTTNTWGDPQNLGPVINTELNDAYPFIAGDILYFSSFGHPGFGGFDIFYSRIDSEGNFSQPENMGSPINSSADDFSFIINDEYTSGFFTSNRPGGSGEDDIYSFRVNQETFVLTGQVVNIRTSEPLDEVELLVYGDDGHIHSLITDSSGNFAAELNPQVNYQIEVNHPDYYPFHESFSVKEKLISSRFLVITDFWKDITLLPVAPVLAHEDYYPTELDDDYADEDLAHFDFEIATRPDITGTREGFPVIFFDFGQNGLDTYAQLQADSLVDYLRANPALGIIVHGHTDEVSSYLFNFYLSQRRSQSVINYLISQGIDQARLFGFGHGKMQLAFENAKTKEEHRMNRRADFESLPAGDFNRFITEAPKYSFRYLNSLTRQAHYSEGIEFMVQFAATKNPVHPRYYRRIMQALPDVDIIYYYDQDRFHRYLTGSFKALNNAVDVHNQLREMGYDTYIVAFKDGERMNVAEANRLVLNK